MKQLLLLFFLLVLLASSAQAQAPTSVRGRVLDGKDQSGLPGANVLLIHLPDSVKSGMAADMDGRFQFDKVAAGRYIVDASFVGFQNQRQTINVNGLAIQLTPLALQAGGIQLKGVVVTGQAAQSVQKGDTTQFNAKAFKTNPDATAGDLLNKLPGVTTGTDGKVQAQGENVTQVLVDGKPFFGTDPDAVLKNLPAEIIDKIEVFDQRSEQSRFSGFDDGNTTKTINFITKAEYRNGAFGRVVAGAGPERYRGSLNYNKFKGEQRMSVLAQSNNVNEQNFGSDDLLGVVGSTGGSGRSGGGGGGGGGTNAGNFLVSQNGGITKTNAAGLNYSNTWNKKTEMTSSYFFNRASNNVLSTTQRYYALPDTVLATRYNQNANAGSVNLNHRFNMRLDQKIDSFNSVLFRPRFSYQQNTGNSLLNGITTRGTENAGTIDSRYNSDYHGINGGGDLLLRHRFRKAGRTLSLGIGGSYNTRDGDAVLVTNNTSAAADSLNQRSTLDQHGGNISGNLAYTESLSKTNGLQANYTVNYTPSNSSKRTFDFERGDNDYTQLNTALSNVFTNYYLTQAGGLSLRHVTPKYQAMVGVSSQYSVLNSNATFPREQKGQYTFVNFLPQAMVNYRFTRQKNLRLFYRTNTNPPSVSQLQAVVNNSNPLQLTIGNPTLRQEFQHSLNMRYSVSNPEVSSNFFALLSGSYTQNPIANRTIVAGAAATDVNLEGAETITLPAGAQITQPVNLSQQYSVRSVASYGRPIKPIKTNVSVNLNASFSQQPGIVNGGLNYARNPAFGAGLSFSSNISPEVDFTVSTNSSKSFVRNTLQERLNSNYFSQVTRARLGWIVGPGINFQTDLVHQAYSGLTAGYNQQYILWNASLGKKIFPGQRGEIKIYAFDLLGQNRSIQRNVTNAYYEDVQTTILQRYFMLMFTYNIRNGNVTVPTEGDGGGREGRRNREGRGGTDGPPGGGPGGNGGGGNGPGGGGPGGGMGGPGGM